MDAYRPKYIDERRLPSSPEEREKGKGVWRKALYCCCRVGKILEFYEGGGLSMRRRKFSAYCVCYHWRLFCSPDATRTNQWSRNWYSIDYIDNASSSPHLYYAPRSVLGARYWKFPLKFIETDSSRLLINLNELQIQN